jgi:hypothetical protein
VVVSLKMSVPEEEGKEQPRLMRLLVKPIYGWGWFGAEGDAVDVPAPFELEITVIEAGQPFGEALGRLQNDVRHPLSDLWILLSQRHSPHDGQCNLTAFAEKPILPRIAGPPTIQPLFAGYASTSQISTSAVTRFCG